jgi:glycosyltransferase involved in cell wall biosynthesis
MSVQPARILDMDGASRSQAPEEPRPAVSVIVACYNEQDTLGDLLTSLTEQTWSGPWEVIVADNGSTDDSVQVAREYETRLPIKLVDAGQAAGQTYASNRGVEASSGAVLLFCNADDVMAPGYVEAMVEALRDHPFVGGQERHDKINARWLQARRRVQNKTEGLIRSDHLPFVAGCTIGLRRTAFERVGGFDESVSNCNDMDLSWRLADEGIHPIHVPEAEFYYRARPTLWSNVTQEYRVARGYASVHRRHGHAHPAAGRPWRYLLREGVSLLREGLRVRNWGDALLLGRRLAWTVGLAVEGRREQPDQPAP